jgi:hypothetical protein
MQEPEERHTPPRRREVAGLGLGRLFLPWSTVAVTIVVLLVAVAGALLTNKESGTGGYHTDAVVAADEPGENIPAVPEESTTSTTAAQAGDASETPTTGTQPKPTTTTMTKRPVTGPTATTAPPTTVTTALPTTTTTGPRTPDVAFVTDYGQPAGNREVYFKSRNGTFPGLKVNFRYAVKEGIKQFTATFGEPRTVPDSSSGRMPDEALYTFWKSEIDSTRDRFALFFHGIVSWEWQGVTYQAPPLVEPKIKVSVVRADHCQSGDNCIGFHFEADRPRERLRVEYLVNRPYGEKATGTAYLDNGSYTHYWPSSALKYDEGDELPGFGGVNTVSWMGGTGDSGGVTDGSSIRFCTASKPC